MNDIFKIQPEWCRSPLPPKDIEHSEWAIEKGYDVKWDRILSFDPAEVYKLIGDMIDPYQRVLSIPVGRMFPDIEGLCACGCGKALGKGRRRWASNVCSSFAWDVRSIICNTHQIPGFYISKYSDGSTCCDSKNRSSIQLDHIVGVKHGGGGCWLPNYQYLCHACHVKKTNQDFGWNKKPKSSQMKLDL